MKDSSKEIQILTLERVEEVQGRQACYDYVRR